ncbi:MAG: ABC transporter ATP-binding protein [Deltaproteobacteria bacterium]|jgi:oligopeptide/dipeptide ABC transporter ATP-binding protein|nr:ABC transporter ATP-binding protein [Deltaproteobacteria bacterium]
MTEPPNAPLPDTAPPLLEIRDLAIGFGDGDYLPVKGLDFRLAKGEVAGLVGESGSGKSLTAYGIMGLLPFGARYRRGEILFQGRDILKLPLAVRRALSGSSMGMIFQEPLTALNPVLTVGEQVAEIFRIRLGQHRREARESACALLSQVGLPNPRAAYASYPHRFSGGMRQRVVIAMALALDPDLVIADEPTTALDPTIALQIIRLLKDMTYQRGAGVLFITHNLRLLSGLAERIFVMYAGLILEETGGGGMAAPLHPYTRGLVAAHPPNPSENSGKSLVPIPGQAPGPRDRLPGCPFAPRCPERDEACSRSLPELLPAPGGGRVRCFRREDAGA